MEIEVNFTVNGEKIKVKTESHRNLLYVLREILNLTGTKEGCGKGECGACTVLMNGKAVPSCLILIPQVEGSQIETIEGLSRNGKLHPLQQAFIDEGAVQCGFCSPGIIMTAKALLAQNPDPKEPDIKTAISGNICRCTGYTKIIKAIKSAAEKGANLL